MSDLNRPSLSSGSFWRLLDGRIGRAVSRIASPLRGVLGTVSADGKGLVARYSARAGEELSDVELAQHFGWRSVAPSGLEAVAVPIGGSSAHLVIIGEIDRTTTPPSLIAGEAAIYSSGGATVIVRSDGSVEISGSSIKLNGPGQAVARFGDTVSVSGTMGGAPFSATGTITSGSSTVQAGG